MPIKRRAAPKRRSSKAGDAPRILSAEEKRELILAHAAARQPLDPMQRFSIAIGVVVCVLVVGGAWLYTAGSGIQKSFAGPLDSDLQAAFESAQILGEDASQTKDEIVAETGKIIQQFQAFKQQQDMIEYMAAQLQASSTAATSTDQ